MAEELQHLIERIQKEAVDTGEKQAATLVSQAREKAAVIVKEAEDKARALLQKAEKDAEAFTERSTKTLSQAARDLLITVGKGVENILSELVGQSVDKALNIQVLEKMLVRMVESYIAKGGSETRLEVLVSPEDKKQLEAFFNEQFNQKLKAGVEIRSDKDIIKGFRVGYTNGQVYHDFTQDAIAEALSNFLRPQLAEIVHRVAKEDHTVGSSKR
jgi:V/A-type H+-transporting ATPase subunit E